jgi:hypothetical protein
MRDHVKQRNGRFWYGSGLNQPGRYKCDICETETMDCLTFVNSHVIPRAHCRNLDIARLSNPMINSCISYSNNGLLLCESCDGHFEDHNIDIAGDGTIVCKGRPDPWGKKYKKLNHTKVKWAHLINFDATWPNSASLEFRSTLCPVVSEHRMWLFCNEDDDFSLEMNEIETECRLTVRNRLQKD